MHVSQYICYCYGCNITTNTCEYALGWLQNCASLYLLYDVFSIHITPTSEQTSHLLPVLSKKVPSTKNEDTSYLIEFIPLKHSSYPEKSQEILH